MSDRITTTCNHTHTVTLRHEADVVGIIGATWTGGEEFHLVFDGGSYAVPIDRMSPAIRAELEVALAAAEAACGGCGCRNGLPKEAVEPSDEPVAGLPKSNTGGGCGCADRLRAEARDLAAVAQECIEAGNERVAKIADAKSVGHFCAADFLDAAPDARGEDA